MKEIGLLCLLLSTTGCGLWRARRGREVILVCEELSALCRQLAHIVKYRTGPCRQALNPAQYPHLSFLSADAVIRADTEASPLSKEENRMLEELLSALGTADAAAQLSVIEGFREYICRARERYAAHYEKSHRLYLGFGTLAGLLLCVLMM